MKKKIGIVGASGYSGEELVRLLLHHPDVELTAVTSRQNAGQTLAQVFPKFANHPRAKTLRFTEPGARQNLIIFSSSATKACGLTACRSTGIFQKSSRNFRLPRMLP